MNDELTHDHPRRRFLKSTGKGLLAAGLAAEAAPRLSAQAGTQSPTSPQPVQFTPINAPTAGAPSRSPSRVKALMC